METELVPLEGPGVDKHPTPVAFDVILLIVMPHPMVVEYDTLVLLVLAVWMNAVTAPFVAMALV